MTEEDDNWRKILAQIWPSETFWRDARLREEAKLGLDSRFRTDAQRYLISNEEYAKSFYFSDGAILEFASPELSSDPAFRDDFADFAELLKSLKHPGILPLLRWGEDDGRLYRAWKRRDLKAAVGCRPLIPKPDHRELRKRELIYLLDAMEVVQSSGMNLGPFKCRTVGYDDGGLFLARFPLTMRSKIPYPKDVIVAPIDAFSLLPREYPRRSSVGFLVQLGCFCSLWLCGCFPTERPPIVSLWPGSEPCGKVDLDLEPELLAEIHRLVEIDCEKAYATMEEGVRELKLALQRSLPGEKL